MRQPDSRLVDGPLWRGRPTIVARLMPEFLGTARDLVELADGRVARTLAVAGYPRRVEPGWLHPIYTFAAEIRIACHVEPIPTAEAVRQLTRHAQTMQASLLLSEARRVPGDAADAAALEDALTLRDALARGQLRLFCYHLLITLLAGDRTALDRLTAALSAEMASRLLLVRRCLFQQPEGFLATMPVGRLSLPCPRNLDSEALATTLPYVAGEFQRPADEVWGRDLRHGGLVAVPRWEYANAHVICVAASGAGKSFWLKSLLTQSLLAGGRVVVFDPQGEYTAWGGALDGQVLALGAGRGDRLCPLPPRPQGDAPEARGDALSQDPEGRSPQAAWRSLCAERVVRALELLGPLAENERAVAWTAVRAACLAQPDQPTLSGLARALQAQGVIGEGLCERLRQALDAGLSALDGDRNVPSDAQLVVFDVSRLIRRSPGLAAVTYFLLTEFVLDRLTGAGSPLTVAVDEAHHLLAHAPTASLVEGLFRTGRKLQVGVCLVTQSVGDLIGEQAPAAAARATRAALANASTAFLMRQQNSREAEWLQRLYRLSADDTGWLLRCGQGEGLALVGAARARTRVEAPAPLHALFGSGPPARASP